MSARRFQETPCIEVHTIGISAVNRAIQAEAIAQSTLTGDELALHYARSKIMTKVGEEEHSYEHPSRAIIRRQY